MGSGNKYHHERKGVARRVAKKLRARPTRSVSLRWYELRYFRARGHEDQMLDNLRKRVTSYVGKSVDMKVDQPAGQELKSVVLSLHQEER